MPGIKDFARSIARKVLDARSDQTGLIAAVAEGFAALDGGKDAAALPDKVRGFLNPVAAGHAADLATLNAAEMTGCALLLGVKDGAEGPRYSVGIGHTATGRATTLFEMVALPESAEPYTPDRVCPVESLLDFAAVGLMEKHPGLLFGGGNAVQEEKEEALEEALEGALEENTPQEEDAPEDELDAAATLARGEKAFDRLRDAFRAGGVPDDINLFAGPAGRNVFARLGAVFQSAEAGDLVVGVVATPEGNRYVLGTPNGAGQQKVWLEIREPDVVGLTVRGAARYSALTRSLDALMAAPDAVDVRCVAVRAGGGPDAPAGAVSPSAAGG